MSTLTLLRPTAPTLPALFQSMPEGGRRFWEFFTVNIRNTNTRRAYFKAVERFAAWCEEKGLGDLAGVTPMHVAAYVEQLGRTHSKPTVKQHLAAIRMLFDWLVTGHIMEDQPGPCGAGAEAQRPQRQDLGALSRRDARACSPQSTSLACSGSATVL